MQYFYKAQCHCIDDSSIHVESEGDRSRTGHFYFRVERFINRGKYTYYYYPLDGALLMCLFFNLNLDDLDAAYEKNKEYFPFATKTWPLLCNAYLRGKNGDFSNPFNISLGILAVEIIEHMHGYFVKRYHIYPQAKSTVKNNMNWLAILFIMLMTCYTSLLIMMCLKSTRLK